MIHFVVPSRFDFTLHEYLGHWGKDLAGRIRIVPTESLPARESFERGTYVLAALDQLGPGMLRFLSALRARLCEVEGIRVLNDPERTLRRFDLLTELRRANRNVHRAVRATDDLGGIRYPVFLRSERSHTGAISPLLRGPGEIDRAIGDALVRGYLVSDLLVVEFCDTADQDGFYRKYAAFVVGRRVIARGLAYGRHWMLKFRDTEWTEPLVLEELEYVRTNPHARELGEIFALAGVEYGRIDYAIQDGRVRTWEINLHPTIGRGTRPRSGRVPAELDPIRQQTKETFYAGFREAWEAADAPGGGPAVSVRLDPEIVRASAEEHPSGMGRTFPALRAALRPARTWLAPISAPLLPLLGRLARGRRTR